MWKKHSNKPKILFHARFPEYTPNDMADPALVDLAIERGAFNTAGLRFNSSLRDVLRGFDPFLGLGTNRSADDSFQRLTYGGYPMRQGLSQSVPTRIVANRTMERQLLFEVATILNLGDGEGPFRRDRCRGWNGVGSRARVVQRP